MEASNLSEISHAAPDHSLLGNIARYYLHGVLLAGIVLLSVMLFASVPRRGEYIPYSMYFFGGALLQITIILGMTFLLLGGVNQVLMSSLWDRGGDQNLASGIRDGLLLHVAMQIMSQPAAITLVTLLNPEHPSADYLLGLAFLVLFSLIYLPAYGFAGRWIGRAFADRART